MIASAGPLFERDDELASIDATLHRLRAGHGGMLVIEGQAGMGKTSLVDEAVSRAHALGLSVLTARGTELEQTFPFAVVRQLFDRIFGERRALPRMQAWMQGAGAQTVRSLGRPATPNAEPGGTDVGYAVLHGLYWLTVEITDDAPTVIVLDDAHWADEPSLQFLQFLHTRIDSLPVCVLIATRPGRAAIAEFTAAGAVVSRPTALALPAVAAMIRHRLTSEPAEQFVQALHRAAGGNPLLLHELIAEIERRAIPPDADRVGLVGELIPDAVVAATELRLAALSAPAMQLVRAVAVLERGELEDAATLAGLDHATAAIALAELRARGVLTTRDPLRFEHPLLRTVVHGSIPEPERRAGHLSAAQHLDATGAAIDVPAAHLLLAAPHDDPWAADILRRAAGRAASVDYSLGATQMLRAALAALPADDAQREAVALELADALSTPSADEAVAVFAQVRARAVETGDRVRAAIGCMRVERLRGRGAGLVEDLLDLRTQCADDPRLAAALDAELLATSSISCQARRQLLPWLEGQLPIGTVTSTLDHVRAACAAIDTALDGRAAAEATELAARAAGGSRSTLPPPLYAHVMSLVGLTYLCTDRFDDAHAVFDSLVTDTVEPQLRTRHASMLAQRASVLLTQGRLADAETDATRALELGSQSSAVLAILPRAAAVLVAVSLERGTPPPVRYLADDLDADSMAHRLLAYSRAEWLLAQGHHAAASDAYLAYGRRNLELGYSGVASPWRSQAALALQPLGEKARATELAHEELAVARRTTVPTAIGIALRACGLLADDRRRTELLSEAVDVVAASPAVLVHARARVSLADDHARRDRLPEARADLRVARDLATDAGAARLVAQIDGALAAAGARPSARRSSGAAALTPAERSTSAHAASGRGNREIAQAMFVTEKTVEAHLRSAYRKLGIRSRQDLPAALARPSRRP